MSENYLRIGLLLIAGVILFLILFEAWQKRRHLKMMKNLNHFEEHFLSEPIEPSYSAKKTAPAPKQDMPEDLLMITILAKPGNQFASYDLLQAILAAGFMHGEKNLFHYHKDGTKLFSLASTTKTGEFDLNNIGEFSCKGLILFLNLADTFQKHEAFTLMLGAAQQLADDLDGELRADPATPWSHEIFQQYQQKITGWINTASYAT